LDLSHSTLNMEDQKKLVFELAENACNRTLKVLDFGGADGVDQETFCNKSLYQVLKNSLPALERLCLGQNFIPWEDDIKLIFEHLVSKKSLKYLALTFPYNDIILNEYEDLELIVEGIRNLI
jgi:hypothetical protein